ncbi:hypothetical protein Anas_02980 [Armadillidium nasatum]|uniref:Uncharacterized protein n=1 Tax=Armadillidium nasatum TaxID=96803 RepID=A0A5N5T614_9CRUS|nr:hypothetical protein Anas_02980 [Armadillidium nasatum]
MLSRQIVRQITMMLKLATVFILVGVFSSSLVKAAAKEECEAMRGKYCPGSKYEISMGFSVSYCSLRILFRTEDKCLFCTVTSLAEFTTLSGCYIKGKANVVCEIKL